MTRAWTFLGDSLEPTRSIPISDRGFRYGMGLFETIRIRSGRAEFLEAHLDRIRRDSESAGLLSGMTEFPSAAPIEALSHTLPDGLLRLVVTGGGGAPWEPATLPAIFLYFDPRPPLPDAAYLTGYRVAAPKLCDATHFRGMKPLGYWANAAMIAQARREGFDEALLEAFDGRLRGAAMANVFLLLDGLWVTPDLSCGARPGVVREILLGKPGFAEGAVKSSDALKAEAALLTSSGLGVMPVRAIDGRELPLFDESLAVWRAFAGSDSR